MKFILKKDPKADTTHYVIVEDLREINYSDYSKITVSYRQIDSYNAKIVVPKKYGNGLTGIYIDSLWGSGFAVNKFNLYGVNLSKDNQEEFLKAIETLKFKSDK